MADNYSNNKRIAVNTILLYFRMFVTIIIGLFTSRVILDSLGVDDFGIYNVVGGFVSMFAIVRSGLVSSTQRFITFDLGRGNLERVNLTFSTICLIYIFLCIIVIIVAESVGYWFIENKLNIPSDRLYASKWVFQLSLITLVVSLLSSPYNSLIIAHERMKAFAYITIYEVLAKLLVAYLIYITRFDKLIVYALLLCIVQITVPLLYCWYCRVQFPNESKIRWRLEWKTVAEIYSFAGWSMMGGIANIGFTQGLNMLLGVFFTPVVNAARGIAVQVQSLVTQFVTNFQMAIDPQIIKSYARGDIEYMSKLIGTSSKFSYFLLLLISLPIMMEAEVLLSWWLVDVPDYTPLFLRLIIITTMFEAISNPYTKAIHATGNIRNYQLICSSILIAIVPVAYVVLKLGGTPYSVFIVHILLGFVVMIIRIILADKIAGVKSIVFFSQTFPSIVCVTVLSFIVPFILDFTIYDIITRFILVVFSSVISVVLMVYVVGLTKIEKNYLSSKLSSYLCKLRTKI